jgi:CBS domain-containing protein
MTKNHKCSELNRAAAPSAARMPDRLLPAPVGPAGPATPSGETPMSIRDIIFAKGRRIETVNGFESLKSAALKMQVKDVAALLVTERTMVRGLLSEREIVQAIAVHGAAAMSMKVREVMMRDLKAVELTDSGERAARLMTRNRVRDLLVLDDEAVVGLLSIDDVVQHRFEDRNTEADLFAHSAATTH